jgi:CheY-like chemotaxis protein/nitrogen-specific signal transduction histidine kinase
VLRDLDRAYYSLDRANNMLVLARAEAEEARDARNRLALAISHELRTPLNFIIGFSELMVNSPQTYGPLETWPPGLYEDVQEIHRSSSHLQRLVNDVLALGQIDSLQMTLFKQWSDPLHIVRDVEKMVQPAFARKKLAFQIQAQMHLPQIYVDSTRIRQVLLNLVSNSLRVTERGGVTIHVRCVGEEVEFCVQDTGPGIAAQDLPKIFQEFVQAGKDSWRRHEGVGLGLPISKRLIELHGGQMRVESTAGEGSCFYFTVPLREAQFARRDATGMTSDTAYWKHLKRKAQDERIVLALSPDPAAGDVIAHYTDGSGIVAVQNIDLLGSAVNELLPSALLVDQGMILNEEDEKALASLPFDLPVVRFAFPGSPQRPGPLPDGVAGYLVKPVERASLLQAIESLGVNIARLLVVDDDPGMVRFVKRTLRSAELSDAPGPPVLATALSGTEALQQVRHNRPDAVLLDLALPDMSGWDVLKDLQARAIPAILMTAYDYPQMLKSEVRDALRVTMRRPLAREELRSVLSCLLKTVRPVYPRLTGAAKRQASRAE